MITEERIEELQNLFWSETNEDWTQEWRDDLTDEEEKLVYKWDRKYNQAAVKMCEQISLKNISIKSIFKQENK